MTPQCTGKHPYASAVRAWRVVKRRVRLDHRRRCTMLDVYRCTRCGFWHVGKNFRSARAAIRWEE